MDDRWLDSAARPFDPPLTAAGVAQGSALGRRLKSFSPPVTKIYGSPLGRTVQTADAAAAELGIDELYIEPGLVEVLDQGWYRCWNCSPSDPRGQANAATLLLSPAELKAQVSPRVQVDHAPFFDVAAMGVRATDTT